MKDYDNFVKKLLAGKLIDYKDIILSTNQIIKDTQKKLKNLAADAEKENTVWKEVCTEFKNRFTVPFEIDIEDSFESVVGKEIPKFYFKYNGEKIEETKLLKILSTGERRALTVLNFLFDLKISYANEDNKEILIILDDVVDSFDYKNKYAIIQYIKDIQLEKQNNNKCVYTWVLTHNFDFFSTFNSRMSEFKALFISKNKNGEELKKFKTAPINGGLSLFKGWIDSLKQEFDEQKFLALIPVCRNIIELTNGKKDADYITLCNILHWRKDTCELKVSEILEIYKRVFKINIEYGEDKKVYNLLKEVMREINKNTGNHEDFDLDAKLVYSINIRRILERIFCLKKPELINSDEKLGKEYDDVKEYLKEEEKKLIIKAIITIPEFIHLNSFMYEPLMDVDLYSLKNLYGEVYKLGKEYDIDECQND